MWFRKFVNEQNFCNFPGISNDFLIKLLILKLKPQVAS